jgi:hypothetical protein
VSSADIAYCAGLFEGEGCVGAYDKKRLHYKWCCVTLKIRMTDVEPLYTFADTFDLGKIYGPLKNRGLGSKDYYQYSLDTYDNIDCIMVQIYPWLSPRRREQWRAAKEKYLSYKDGSRVW